MIKKRDVLVVGALLVVAACLFWLSSQSASAPGPLVAVPPAGVIEVAPAPPAARETAPAATAPAASAPASPAAAAKAPEAEEAEPEISSEAGGPSAGDASQAAYLSVTVRGVQYEPILLDQEADYTLRQKDTGAENHIHVTKDSIRMASSTCENQDCVEQGIVSSANRDQRLLRNMIICLPNEVTLELLSAQEVAQMRAGNEDAG